MVLGIVQEFAEEPIVIVSQSAKKVKTKGAEAAWGPSARMAKPNPSAHLTHHEVLGRKQTNARDGLQLG